MVLFSARMGKYSALYFLVFAASVWGWAYRIFRLNQSLSLTPFINPSSRPAFHHEKISVIIPMKNEEANAKTCLEALLKQDYKNFEIIVINDNSLDRTGEIVKSFPDVICIENKTPTPEGWTGKNFAIHQGVSSASGQWLLFSDADTRHEPASLSASLAHIQQKDLEFLTLLPRCICETFIEKMIQPIAMAFLGLWFPIQKVNDPNSSMYFGNGQYLMIKKKLYDRLGGHEAVRGEFLEDYAFARKVKEVKARGECAMGKDIYGTRMYHSFDTAWKGWRRIYLHAFQKKSHLLLMRAVETFFLSVFPFLVLFIAGLPPGITGGFLGLCILIYITSWKAYRFLDSDPKFAVFHPAASFLIVLFLLDAFWIASTKGKTIWR